MPDATHVWRTSNYVEFDPTRPDPSDGAAHHVFSRGPKSFVKQLTIVDRALLTPGPALDDAAKRIVGGLGRFL